VKPPIVGAVLAFSLLFAPLAHADTNHVPIGDPYTDTLQLWSKIAAALSTLTTDFAALFSGHDFASTVSWLPLSQSQASSSLGWTVQNDSVVYQAAIDSGGVVSNVTIQTNPSEFFVSAIDPDFGKDDDNVYYDGFTVPAANPTTFVVLSPRYDGLTDGAYGKDNERVYYESSGSSGTVAPIQEADSATFASLGYGYAKDEKGVYLFGNIILGADPNTFLVLGPSDAPEGSLSGDTYAKDKNQIYLDGRPLPSYVDVDSFVLVYDAVGDPTSYAKDKNNVYNAYDGSIVSGADPRTFKVLSPYYAEDKQNVYSFDGPTSNVAGTSVTPIGANPSTFHLVSGDTDYDASDGKTDYYHGRPVEN
jgi:DKNYY family